MSKFPVWYLDKGTKTYKRFPYEILRTNVAGEKGVYAPWFQFATPEEKSLLRNTRRYFKRQGYYYIFKPNGISLPSMVWDKICEFLNEYIMDEIIIIRILLVLLGITTSLLVGLIMMAIIMTING